MVKAGVQLLLDDDDLSPGKKRTNLGCFLGYLTYSMKNRVRFKNEISVNPIIHQ